MNYIRSIAVEFNHCDPAGIVFYPRYFEMCNSVVENFFAEGVGLSFAEMHRDIGSGVPTVNISSDFHMPSRLGDKLTFSLGIERIGSSSASLLIEGHCGSERRLTLRPTIVWIKSGKAEKWPEHIREKLENFVLG